MGQVKKIISLFSGAGGFDIGFEMAGFETAVAVEYDSACCDTLRKNKPNLPVLCGDISKISTSEILSKGKLKVGEAAVLIGGPPCQSFSLAGKRMGMDDERGKLVLEFIRIVRESLPLVFVMENVKGMANWQKGAAVKAIMNEISTPIVYNGQEYSYKINKAILNAADYGAPQFRERIFLVGNRMNKSFKFPNPTHGNNTSNDLFGKSVKPYTTVWDAIGKLPKAQEPSENAKRISKTIKERIKKHGY